MSEEQEMSSGQPAKKISDQTGGDTQLSTGGTDKVGYDTYKKVLGEKKAVDVKLRELELKFENMEIAKMTAEGNKDELLDKFQKQNIELHDRLKKKDEAYAFATLGSQVKTEAARMGCQDPDSLVKLMDLSSVPVDPESFKADTDSVRMMLEDQKKTRPFFFGKQAPTIHDVSQSNTIPQRSAKKPSEMNPAEFAAAMEAMGKEQL